MNTSRTSTAAEATAPGRDLQYLFPAPVFLPGEDKQSYDDLLARVKQHVGPRDIFEEFFVRDAVDLFWETLRIRRHKALLLQAYAHEGVGAALRPIIGNKADTIAAGYATGSSTFLEQAEQTLQRAGKTIENAVALTLEHKLKEFERLDALAASAEARRCMVLRELDRHRAAVASRLRDALDVEEAHLEEVAPRGG